MAGDTEGDTVRGWRKSVSQTGPVAYAADRAFAVLTDEAVARARCADGVDRVVLRCRKRGLELHLYRSGKPARWYARPRVGGERKRINLGPLGALPTVAEANAALAAALAGAAVHGKGSLEDRGTFGGLVADFLAEFEARKRARSAENYRGALTRLALPRLGKTELRRIRRADLVECLKAAHADLVAKGLKGTEAQTLRAAVQGAWRWGLAQGRVEADIVARLPVLVEENPRENVLTDAQLALFWRATDPADCSPLSNTMAHAFRCALLTAQRIGAVLLARACDLDLDLDLDAGVWRILPQDGTKIVGVPHHVPLPPMAKQAWAAALASSMARGEGFVFPADRGRRSAAGSIRQDSAANAMARLREERPDLGEATLQDLRRTARTRIAGAVHREDAERWIGHVVGSKVERTYDRSQHLDEKRAAAEAWEACLGGLGIGVADA